MLYQNINNMIKFNRSDKSSFSYTRDTLQMSFRPLFRGKTNQKFNFEIFL